MLGIIAWLGFGAVVMSRHGCPSHMLLPWVFVWGLASAVVVVLSGILWESTR